MRNATLHTCGRNPAKHATGDLSFEAARSRHSRSRAGFTLVELLVVIAILLTLTTLTVVIFNANSSSDKIRSAARTAQSAFLGARDRALHAGAMNALDLAAGRRGVRLLRDSQDASLVTGFAYIRPIDNLKYGRPLSGSPIQVEYFDTNGDGSVEPRLVRGFGVDWDYLVQAGELPYPARIRIPASGEWYTFNNVQAVPSTNPREVTLTLLSDLRTPDNAAPALAIADGSPNASCLIEVGYEILPYQAPIALPSGVVIDLDFSSSNVTSNWPAGPPHAYIDIMFSPRGMITGPLAARGPIHFLLNDVQDATQNLNPIDPANKGEKLILTVFPQTGHVATYPIDPTDIVNNTTGAAGADGSADNLFRFAQIGSAAGQ